MAEEARARTERKPPTLVVVSRKPVEDSGAFGIPSISKIAVKRIVRGKPAGRIVTLFEKNYPSPGAGFAQHSVRVYSRLKELGMRVPTTYRLVEFREGWPSILQTDLTFKGKSLVTPAIGPGQPNQGIIRRIRNWDEVVGQMRNDVQKAAEHGMLLNKDEWMISVDKKTGKAQVYLTDFDRTVMRGKPDLESDLAALDKWKAEMERVRKARR